MLWGGGGGGLLLFFLGGEISSLFCFSSFLMILFYFRYLFFIWGNCIYLYTYTEQTHLSRVGFLTDKEKCSVMRNICMIKIQIWQNNKQYTNLLVYRVYFASCPQYETLFKGTATGLILWGCYTYLYLISHSGGLGSSVGRACDSCSGGPGCDPRCGRLLPTGWVGVSIIWPAETEVMVSPLCLMCGSM